MLFGREENDIFILEKELKELSPMQMKNLKTGDRILNKNAFRIETISEFRNKLSYILTKREEHSTRSSPGCCQGKEKTKEYCVEAQEIKLLKFKRFDKTISTRS